MADYDLTKEEEVKEYLKNIETEYSFQCLHEKEPDGCHRLADFINSVKGDEVKGTTLYKKNCDDYKYGHSCYKYAGKRALGKGVEANGDEGALYFEKACEYGYIRGCANAGILYVDGNIAKKDYDKGLKYLAMACEKDQGESCSALGTGHLLAKYGLEKDTQKAIVLLKKGCELGSITGCVNVSRMYKTGDGVQRNDALAYQYSQLAKKIQASLDGGNNRGISLGRTS